MAAAPQDLEGAVEGEEGLEQVLLVPETVLLEDGVLGIFGRQKDVVDVDDDSGVQAREDLQKLVLNVAADFEHVAGVDEQDIVLAEPGELVEGDLLHGLDDESSQSG